MLRFCGKLRGMSRQDLSKRIEELVDQLSLSQIIDHRCKGYSGGESQRLSFAAALLGDTELVLLDEPVAAMDPVGRAQVLKIITELGKEKTVFFSTHILDDVERTCSQVAILHEGEILRFQPTEELLADHRPTGALLQISFREAEGLQLLTEALHAHGVETRIPKEQPQGLSAVQILTEERERISKLLPELLSSQELGLYHFEWLDPSLEEIFMRIVAEQ